MIDCAEWVGGVEDLRLGFQNVWKYHYTPSMHENLTTGELLINGDVWRSLTPTQQEQIKSAANETFLLWWAKWQKQNADAIEAWRSWEAEHDIYQGPHRDLVRRSLLAGVVSRTHHRAGTRARSPAGTWARRRSLRWPGRGRPGRR